MVYHWQPDAEAPRPPCNIVDKITMAESLQVGIDVIDFTPRVGYVIVTAGGKHELCKVCARALQRAGFL